MACPRILKQDTRPFSSQKGSNVSLSAKRESREPYLPR